MTRETSRWDTLVAACLSFSWVGAWPPTEWMVGNRPDVAIPEPRRGEDGFNCAFGGTAEDEMLDGDRGHDADDDRGAS